jgi:hypothetical protein
MGRCRHLYQATGEFVGYEPEPNMRYTVLSILQGYIGFLPVGQATQALIGIGIAVCIVILRSVTTTALSDK